MFDENEQHEDYCEICKRVVPEDSEHDHQAHGSTAENAAALAAWRSELEATGGHH